ncbi:hypothetical protein B9G69_004545 [Bdellovibrio sp. SKB1291214]|uniref:hypothetical protein n=1 Tax=Bdellovibrio sp. SKB1291214 TaxID=1732569 RepID=UPI000B5198D4|nr:hypothetical protein [Bdellovibrio sp. SKB1291214]UYL09844.1 hypothetical protein B9G69_004545 [Bdellovibrio sp. SKB1291214]
MKKLILASALLIITAGCQQGSKSDSATSKDITPQLQNQDVAAQENNATESSDTLIDSTSRQDAMKDLQTKVFKVALRMDMDIAANTDTAADFVLLKEFFTKKGPKDLTVRKALNSGEVKAAIELKDLQGALTDKQMQSTAILKSFKKIAAIYGYDSAKQDAIAEALQKRDLMLNPGESELATVKAFAANVNGKANALIGDFHSGNNEKLCGSLAIFVNNYKAFLSEKQRISLPALIATQVAATAEIEKVIETCKENVPAVRKALGQQLPALIAQNDAVQGLIKLYIDPTIRDNSPLALDIASRWKLDETTEVLAARSLPSIGEIQVDSIVCQIGGKIMGASVKSFENDVTIGTVDFEQQGETPLTIRKEKGQRGVTISYASSQVSILDAGSTTVVNAGEGFAAAVRNMIPGDTQVLTMTLGSQQAPVFVNCRAK